MKILILSGTKFVGPHVARRLNEQGHEVAIFHRGEAETDLPSSVRHVHGDFSEFAKHVDQLRALSHEVVLDMVPFRARRVCCASSVRFRKSLWPQSKSWPRLWEKNRHRDRRSLRAPARAG